MPISARMLTVLTAGMAVATVLLGLFARGDGIAELVLFQLPVYAGLWIAWLTIVFSARQASWVRNLVLASALFFAVNVFSATTVWLQHANLLPPHSSAPALILNAARLLGTPVWIVRGFLNLFPSPTAIIVAASIASLLEGFAVAVGIAIHFPNTGGRLKGTIEERPMVSSAE